MDMVDYAHNKRATLALIVFSACIIMFFVERMHLIAFSPISIIAIVIALIRYFYLCVQSKREVLFSSFYQIYAMLALLLSAIAISSGAYMLEVGAFGSANGSVWVILAYFIAGIEATFRGFQSKISLGIAGKIIPQPWPVARRLILVIVCAVGLIGFYILFTAGSPILIGVDRVTFWRSIAPEHFSFIPSLITQTYFFICYYTLVAHKMRDHPAASVFVIFLYIFITVVILGQKFSAFILLASAWLMVLPGVFPNFKIRALYVLPVVVISILLLLLVVWSYSLSGRDASFIFYRVALQAQLIWSVLSDPYNFKLFPSSDWRCYFGCGFMDSGQDYISLQYLPFDLYKYYYSGGTTLSGFMPALSILTFGIIISFLIHLLVCFMLGVMQREICLTVRKGNFIASFLLYKVQLGFMLMWFSALNSTFIGIILAAIALIIYLVLFGWSILSERRMGAVRG